MKPRLLIWKVALIALVPTVLYLALSSLLYTRIAAVLPNCAGEFTGNTPASFSADPFDPALDTVPYFMPEFQTVSLSSRDPGVTLSAWYVPAHVPDAPSIVITHGLGVGTADCRRNPRALLPAGMLHKAGYNVLLIDLREHGASTIEDGLWAANTEEYLDVLGAWDWLVNERHAAPTQIGLFGYSGGTGATMIAMGEESRIAAAWLDSVYADLPTTIADQLARSGYPKFLTFGGLFMARLHGNDLTAFSPLDEVNNIHGRPLFITHSDADPVLSINGAYRLESALCAAGNRPEFWVVHSSGHVRAMFDQRQEYERHLIAFFNTGLHWH